MGQMVVRVFANALVGAGVAGRAAAAMVLALVLLAAARGILVSEPAGDLVARAVEESAAFAVLAPLAVFVAALAASVPTRGPAGVVIVVEPARDAVAWPVRFARAHAAAGTAAIVEVTAAEVLAGEVAEVVAAAGIVVAAAIAAHRTALAGNRLANAALPAELAPSFVGVIPLVTASGLAAAATQVLIARP